MCDELPVAGIRPQAFQPRIVPQVDQCGIPIAKGLLECVERGRRIIEGGVDEGNVVRVDRHLQRRDMAQFRARLLTPAGDRIRPRQLASRSQDTVWVGLWPSSRLHEMRQ